MGYCLLVIDYWCKNKSIAMQCILTPLTPHSSLLTLKISKGDF